MCIRSSKDRMVSWMSYKDDDLEMKSGLKK